MLTSVIVNRITDIYDTVQKEDGSLEEVIVKSNIKLKTRVKMEDVEAILEVCNNHGRKYKSKCLLKVRSLGDIIIDMAFDEADKLFFNSNKIGNGLYRNTSKRAGQRSF